MFAVIDTETTYADEVMSIGIVMADEETFRPVDARYYIIGAPPIRPAACSPMCSSAPSTARCRLRSASVRGGTRSRICAPLWRGMARTRSLPTTRILTGATCRSCGRIIGATLCGRAAYRQFNPTIPADADCYATGRLKCGCGVEATLRRLLGRADYYEVHNALADAVDELLIMRLLAHPLCLYQKPAKAPRAAR